MFESIVKLLILYFGCGIIGAIIFSIVPFLWIMHQKKEISKEESELPTS